MERERTEVRIAQKIGINQRKRRADTTFRLCVCLCLCLCACEREREREREGGRERRGLVTSVRGFPVTGCSTFKNSY